jgi:hypothetical protein
MLFKAAIIIYHHSNLIATIKLPNPVIVNFLHVTEPVAVEIILHKFQEPYLVRKERIFVLLCFAGEIEAHFNRNHSIILTVTVKPGELPPVDVPLFIGFTVEHIRINTTDSETAFINPAPPVVQEQAGSTGIILGPQCIPRNIEYAILVAKFRVRCWFEGFRIE